MRDTPAALALLAMVGMGAERHEARLSHTGKNAAFPMGGDIPGSVPVQIVHERVLGAR